MSEANRPEGAAQEPGTGEETGATPPAQVPPFAVDEALAGARVQAVHQPGPREIVLLTHHPAHGELPWLLSFTPEQARLVRGTGAGRKRRNPARPGVFCQWLRSRLVGGRLQGLRLRCGNVLDLPVETAQGTLHLILELNRQDSNLLLLDAEARLLIAARHPHLPGRTLGPGKPYLPPQRLAGLPLEQTDDQRLPAADPETARERERLWRGEGRETDFATRQRDAQRTAKRRIKALERRLAQVAGDAARADDAETLRQEAELLSIHRHLLVPGADAVTLPDEFDPARPQRTLALDPTLSPEENIARRFAVVRKRRDAAPHVAQRQAQTQAELTQWRDLLAQVQAASTDAELPALPQDGRRQGGPPPRGPAAKGKGAAADELMARESSEGFRIFIGRSKQENDRLTFRLSNGRDWWLHAQGVSGSHVVVRNPGDGPLPRRTLLEAAWLAAYYSSRRKAGKVDVDYTQRKHVRRIKGAEPGQVTYAHNGTLLIDLEDAALKPVLGRVPQD